MTASATPNYTDDTGCRYYVPPTSEFGGIALAFDGENAGHWVEWGGVTAHPITKLSVSDAIASTVTKLMKRHPGMKIDTAWARARQGELSARALAHPEGLTKYAYTKGMAQGDALAFWTDAAVLGFVKLGRNDRGTNVFGWRSTVEEVTAP